MNFGQYSFRLIFGKACAGWIAVILFWLASVCFPTHYFGTIFTMRYGSGRFGLFWGGDADLRNSYVFNGAHWPPAETDHFGGEDWFQYAGWGFQFYGYLCPWQSCAEPFTFRLFACRLGIQLPTIRLNSEGSGIDVPLGSILATLGAGGLVYRLCYRRHSAGSCSKCGYCLTGLQSHCCPECGSEIQRRELDARCSRYKEPVRLAPDS